MRWDAFGWRGWGDEEDDGSEEMKRLERDGALEYWNDLLFLPAGLAGNASDS
jgi:hypothetical protein